MARKRMLSPDIWRDKKTIQLNNDELIVMIGAISSADDEGLIEPDPDSFFFELGRRDLTPGKISKSFKRLFELGILIPYGDFAIFPNWFKHQYIERPQPTKHRKPPKQIIQKYPEYIDQWLITMRKTKEYKDLIDYPYGPEINHLSITDQSPINHLEENLIKTEESKKNIANSEQMISRGTLTDQSPTDPAYIYPTKKYDDLKNIAIEEQEIAHRSITDQSPNDHGLITPKRKEKKRKEKKGIEINTKEINLKKTNRTEHDSSQKEKGNVKKIAISAPIKTMLLKDWLELKNLKIAGPKFIEMVDLSVSEDLDNYYFDKVFDYSKSKNPNNITAYFITSFFLPELIKDWQDIKGLNQFFPPKQESNLNQNCPDCKKPMIHDKNEFQCKECQSVYNLTSGKLIKISAEEIPKEKFDLKNYLKTSKTEKQEMKIIPDSEKEDLDIF